MSTRYTIARSWSGRWLVIRPVPGSHLGHAVLDCATEEAARREADRLNAQARPTTKPSHA